MACAHFQHSTVQTSSVLVCRVCEGVDAVQVFHAYDEDRNGMLSFAEFESLIKHLEQKIGEHPMPYMLAKVVHGAMSAWNEIAYALI